MKTDPTIAAAKLKMLNASVRCLVLGLLSLLPILGAGFALFSLWYSFVARQQERWLWNPAKPHRMVGLICALIGALVWSCVDTILLFYVCDSYIHS